MHNGADDDATRRRDVVNHALNLGFERWYKEVGQEVYKKKLKSRLNGNLM